MRSRIRHFVVTIVILAITRHSSAQFYPDERIIDRQIHLPSLNSVETDYEIAYPQPPFVYQKRSSIDDPDEDNELTTVDRSSPFANKRAPPGFLGVRGKKLLAELMRASNNNNNHIVDDDLNDEASDHPFEVEFKRVPNGFMGMRGKKEFFVSDAQVQHIRQWLQQHREEMRPAGGGGDGESGGVLRAGAKRDPVRGFMGVRGKRLLDRLAGLGYVGEDSPKRADGPAMGFVGMRGKKWDDRAEYN